ncbi:BarA sensory histidine kinase (= VarS = GacS) [hydrothermal vent metagenome]|uniref:BarA sensory histidine kinase (= VarS = GacS) n=1 Tax=hydrothermal vent metagenome TaxID=652676 RepID=A0A1W1C4Z9_9ZZZZ
MKKIFRNTFVLNLLLVLTAMAIVVSSYLTYLSYLKYTKPSKGLELPLFLEKVSSTLDTIDAERLPTVSYLATADKMSFKNMKKARSNTDKILIDLNNILKTNASLEPYSKYIKDINNQLQIVRNGVDNLSEDEINILFDDYHGKVFSIFYKMIGDVTLDQSSKTLTSYLSTYRNIMDLRENSATENNIIYLTLLKKAPMDYRVMTIWEQLVAKDVQPNFDDLYDAVLAVDLRAIMSPEEYIDILFDYRRDIEEHYKSGNYTTSTIAWLDGVEKKMNYYMRIEKMLIVNIKKRIEDSFSKSTTMLISLSLISLLLLRLLFKIISMRRELNKNKKLYTDTLRDIELVFDEGQQMKLKRLIESGNLNLIYKFLIQAIQDANTTKDLFLASMSHEIRTPLNGIVGFTQLLKETDMNEEQQEFLSVVEKSSDHLLRIVNDVLDLAKIKAQKIELEHIAFDPMDYFEAAVESYAGKAFKENIDFNVYIDPSLPTLLMGDPTKISQVIVNLISNAIKFTPENGTVSVAIEKLYDKDNSVKVKFSVEDTGIGITKDQQKNIFDAFSQADVSTSRKYGGTGLGLSISGKLIDIMGGKLSIMSVQGKGSTFFFSIELEKAKDSKDRVVDNMNNRQVGILNPHKGSEYIINKNLEAYVAYTGATVTHYTNETLEQAKSLGNAPDILFIDHKYRMRGDELEQVLDIESKVIVLTTGDQKKNLLKYGRSIDKLLYKPVTFTKTIKALSNKQEVMESTKAYRFENLKVLVAEDNVINQKLIINILTKMGVDVDIANNGQEALEKRKENIYDIIFMDIEMPIMGGIEATAKIMSYERNNQVEHIPIIALTANALTGDKAKYIGVGMNGYLAKPINLNELRKLFKEYFEDKIIEV